jgi:hypothetical protein
LEEAVTVFVGVTTYNRESLVRTMSASLGRSGDLSECRVHVFDDCSSDYGPEKLREYFPTAQDIRRNDVNIGPDRNMRNMYVEFLNTDCDVFFAADSDLIFDRVWIDVLRRALPLTDGVLSLYNSARHREIRRFAMSGVTFVEKPVLGSAGTAMTRQVVSRIVEALPPRDNGFDWAWSQLLQDRGVRLLATASSHVQHVGFEGHNCNAFDVIEIGRDFETTSPEDKELLLRKYEELLVQVASPDYADSVALAEARIRKSSSYRVGRALTWPLRRLKAAIRCVLPPGDGRWG